MAEVGNLFESPYTGLAVGIVLGALALSGKPSVTATQTLLLAAWAVCVFGLRGQPLPVKVGGAAMFGGALVLLGYYFRPDAVPSFTGVLTPTKSAKTIFSADGPIPKIQIGTSGVFIVGANHQGPIGELLMPALKASQLKVESIGGQMKVSAQVANYGGVLMAELIRNEWRVAPPPGTWDRNYSDDALEVKNPQGHVVLQIRLREDVVQIQGVWPLGPEWKKNSLAYVAIMKNPEGDGAQFKFYPIDPPPSVAWPEIEPIFKYPSDAHLGEFVK